MYERFSKDAIIVQKYGGTSVGSIERIQSVAKRTANLYRQGYQNIAVVVSAMSGETNRLVDLVNLTNKNASFRSYDLAVAAGEQVSVALMTAALEAEGLEVSPYLAYQLGILTDEHHGKARVISVDTSKIYSDWHQNKIAVIAGFQGITKDNAITTLGRGGSDTSAVALACALKASFCEINTDVDGVFTTDPRIVSEAKLIKHLDFEVALEMASMGSKVLHPRCVELAAKYNIPLVVRNTFTPDDHQRTIVMNLQNESIESAAVNGITLDKQVAAVSVTGALSSSHIAQIFTEIAAAQINVDVISFEKTTSDYPNNLGFTISETDIRQTQKAFNDFQKKVPGLNYSIEEGFCKVTAVGVGMRSYAGVAAQFFASLQSKGIEIYMISTSEIKISAVIKKDQGELAVQLLHKAFALS